MKRSSDKPRLCLIYTGGTIGMAEQDGVLRPPDDPSDFLKVAPELNEFVEIDALFLLNKDSTNMNPTDWTTICNAIYERIDAGYRGFVVAHGTDTMHFTASALAFAFGPGLNFPIVLTGAQTSPNVVHGDARVNLLRACKTAIEPIAEVGIVFNEYVFRGCRAQKKDERRFDAFESPAFTPLAYITETVDIQPLARLVKAENSMKKIVFSPVFSEGIFQVSLIPGLDPDMLIKAVRSKSCKGLILQSFGAGNVPDEHAGKFSFKSLIEEVVGSGKPVVITSQFPGGSTLPSRYQPHVTAVKAGAIPTGNMTSSAAAVKFRWVLSQVDDEIKAKKVKAKDRLKRIATWMGRKYVGELGTLTSSFTDPDPDGIDLQSDKPINSGGVMTGLQAD